MEKYNKRTIKRILRMIDFMLDEISEDEICGDPLSYIMDLKKNIVGLL